MTTSNPSQLLSRAVHTRNTYTRFNMAGLPPKFDVHHHIVPDFYKQVLSGVDLPAKIQFPSWSPEASLAFVNDHHIDTAILSLSAPGAVIAGSRDDVRALVRK